MVSAGDLVLVEFSNATGCYYYLSVSIRDLLIMDRFSDESAWSLVGIHSRKGSDGDLVITRNQLLAWRIPRDPFPIIWLGINSGGHPLLRALLHQGSTGAERDSTRDQLCLWSLGRDPPMITSSTQGPTTEQESTPGGTCAGIHSQ